MFSPQQRQFVFERAGYRCEYCTSPISHAIQPFHVEHIVPLSKNGTSDPSNLACSCGGCNGHKYDKIHAIDPITEQSLPLFHPRLMNWTSHFTWSSDFAELIGVSSIGRATVQALQLNRLGIVNIRRLLLLVGLHPPEII